MDLENSKTLYPITTHQLVSTQSQFTTDIERFKTPYHTSCQGPSYMDPMDMAISVHPCLEYLQGYTPDFPALSIPVGGMLPPFFHHSNC